MLPKESLLRQHEHDRQKESIMTHASLNIYESKWNVNRSQRPTPLHPKDRHPYMCNNKGRQNLGKQPA